jgi:hypothetical protein
VTDHTGRGPDVARRATSPSYDRLVGRFSPILSQDVSEDVQVQGVRPHSDETDGEYPCLNLRRVFQDLRDGLQQGLGLSRGRTSPEIQCEVKHHLIALGEILQRGLSGQSLLSAMSNGGSGPLLRRYIVAQEMAAGEPFPSRRPTSQADPVTNQEAQKKPLTATALSYTAASAGAVVGCGGKAGAAGWSHGYGAGAGRGPSQPL